MWKAFFFAFGVSLIILGVECFLVDQVEVTRLKRRTETPQANTLFGQPQAKPASFVTPIQRDGSFKYQPKEWVPWSLLAIGTVVLIYTCTLPGRSKGDSD